MHGGSYHILSGNLCRAAHHRNLLPGISQGGHAKKLQELKSANKTLETKLTDAQLEGIRHKMNPHLFKNILNSIQSHAYQTYFALDKLGNVLDYILYETEKEFVSVKEEVDFALSLIEINKLKLSPLFADPADHYHHYRSARVWEVC